MGGLDLVLERELLGVLRIELHVRLGIEQDELDFPVQEPALGVEFFDRERGGVGRRFPVDFETAREVENGPDLDRAVLSFRACARAQRERHCGGGRSPREKLPSIDHCRLPVSTGSPAVSLAPRPVRGAAPVLAEEASLGFPHLKVA